MIAETFVYRGWEWGIYPARQLVANRAPVSIAVAEFAPMLNTIHVDESYTGQDLTAPVLVCDLTTPVDGRARLLIDGWHRLHAAARQGVTTLPAWILTAAEGLSASERVDCFGCGHCEHVQFDDDDTDHCHAYCNACGAELDVLLAATEREWRTTPETPPPRKGETHENPIQATKVKPYDIGNDDNATVGIQFTNRKA